MRRFRRRTHLCNDGCGGDSTGNPFGGTGPSGYGSRPQENWCGQVSPPYPWMKQSCPLPLRGDACCQGEFACWFEIRAGQKQKVISMCCGAATLKSRIADSVRHKHIVGVDLGEAQPAWARYRNRSRTIDFGVARGFFHSVLIPLPLPEPPSALRLRVLAGSRRLCASWTAV